MSAIHLQPLRITHGWTINWNSLYEIDPTRENIEAFLFTSSSLFSAVHAKQGLMIDVAWMPPDEPDGRYLVETYQAPRTANSSDGGEVPKGFNYYRDGALVSTYETRLRMELVAHLEDAMHSAWQRE